MFWVFTVRLLFSWIILTMIVPYITTTSFWLQFVSGRIFWCFNPAAKIDGHQSCWRIIPQCHFEGFYRDSLPGKREREGKPCLCEMQTECGKEIIYFLKKTIVSRRQESALDWGEDLQKTCPWWVWIIWHCGRATYSWSGAFLSANFFLLQKKKAVTFWQLVNTVLRPKGQEVS